MTEDNKITVRVYERDWWTIRKSKRRGETLADSLHRLIEEAKKDE